MKKLLKMIGLQFFADGGGGNGGAASAGGGSSAGAEGTEGTATEAQIPANIPERARKHYKAAMEDIAKRNAGKPASADTATAQTKAPTEEEKTPVETVKRTYRELVESDEYKDYHRRAIQKAVDDRMKTHKADLSEANELLALAGRNFGLDPASETFRADLKKAMATDENAIRRYADANDMSFDEAKRAMELESRLANANAEAERARNELEQRRIADENQRIWNDLEQKATETRKQYPDFDLRTAMQDPQFRAVLNAWNGDTTAAYESINRHKLFEAKRIAAEKAAEERVANSVRANANRPQEGAISSNQNVVATDVMGMSEKEFAEHVASLRRNSRRT